MQILPQNPKQNKPLYFKQTIICNNNKKVSTIQLKQMRTNTYMLKTIGNTTRGTPSSFGSFVTAQGGAGNAGGNGQFGEMKFSIVDIPESETSINVSIGAGGSVDIFY